MPDKTVYVGRPSKFANKFKIPPWTKRSEMKFGRRWATDQFRIWINSEDPHARILKATGMLELHDMNIACWCPLDQHCHGDVWLELAATN